jgi:hypothetical protein
MEEEMMKRQKLLDNYRGTKNHKVMSCVAIARSGVEDIEEKNNITGRRLKKQMKKRKFSFSIELILVILLLMVCC